MRPTFYFSLFTFYFLKTTSGNCPGSRWRPSQTRTRRAARRHAGTGQISR